MYSLYSSWVFFFFQAEDGIRDLVRSRGLGDVYKRQRLVSRKALTLLAHRIGLDKFVLLNVSAEQSLEQGNDSLLADAFEAIIAVSYTHLTLPTSDLV